MNRPTNQMKNRPVRGPVFRTDYVVQHYSAELEEWADFGPAFETEEDAEAHRKRAFWPTRIVERKWRLV